MLNKDWSSDVNPHSKGIVVKAMNLAVICAIDCGVKPKMKKATATISIRTTCLCGIIHLTLWGGAQCSTALHKGVTEVSVEFYSIDHHDIPLNSYTVKIKRCGVCLLYADDTK
ncbi:hypothetical protein C1H46_019340 [Malus baccata]|uniref:Uncharacterized protein n=1 Tax=Malus baccata TaxID=106549 RepID=A0A540M950_MALBA|nr:hypothetical protein C1H46_019340 [Malus baccata]